MRFRPGTNDHHIWESVYQQNEYDLPDQFNPSDTIIDIGAHTGSFSQACLDRRPHRVISFEPDADNFKMLIENLQGYSLASIAYNMAVWASDGSGGSLFHTGPSMLCGLVNAGAGNVLGTEGTPVESMALDTVIETYRPIRMIKFDCECSEWPIIATSKLIGGGAVKEIVGELHCPAGAIGKMALAGVTEFNSKTFTALLESKGFIVTMMLVTPHDERLYHFKAQI